MFKLLLLIALIPAVVFGTVNHRGCRNQPQPHQVRIRGCTQMPCPVNRGEDAVMEMDFTPNRHVTRITPSVNAIVLGLPVNYPLPDHLLNSCATIINGQCPLAANQRSSLVFRFPVNRQYPPVTVSVSLTLRAQDNSVISCFTVDIQVRA